MDNNNPAQMSNQDLEDDMKQKSGDTNVNQENVNKSSAAEGSLITPDNDESSKIAMHTAYHADEEQDLDDLVHTQAAEAKDSQDGSIPDPEALDHWEMDEDDTNKISG